MWVSYTPRNYRSHGLLAWQIVEQIRIDFDPPTAEPTAAAEATGKIVFR